MAQWSGLILPCAVWCCSPNKRTSSKQDIFMRSSSATEINLRELHRWPASALRPAPPETPKRLRMWKARVGRRVLKYHWKKFPEPRACLPTTGEVTERPWPTTWCVLHKQWEENAEVWQIHNQETNQGTWSGKKKQLNNYFVDESASPLHWKEPVSPLRMDVVKEDKEFLGPGEAQGR